MQVTFDKSTSTVWLFVSPSELLEMAAAAQQKITEAQLGESLTVFESEVKQSVFSFRISVTN